MTKGKVYIRKTGFVGGTCKMILSGHPMQNDPVLAVAVRAARRGASVLLDAARDLKRLPAHSKGHADIAAEADTEAENAMIATLRTAFPAHAIVGEESGEIVSRIEDGSVAARNAHRWIIDPLDGTANFTHGYPYYAVSLALAQGGEITHAVILDPVHDEIFTAILGKGARHNGTTIRTSTCVRLDEALVGAMFPPQESPRLPAFLPAFSAVAAQCADIRRAGACALDFAYVACGRLDGFWAMTGKSSDVAAGSLIVTEAGGRIGDLAGGAGYLKTGEAIAATPGVFNALRDAIAAARRLPSQTTQ